VAQPRHLVVRPSIDLIRLLPVLIGRSFCSFRARAATALVPVPSVALRS